MMLGLFAQIAAAHGFEKATAPLPPQVLASLPKGVGLPDILVDHGCYYFIKNGDVHPLTTAWTGAAPLCVE